MLAAPISAEVLETLYETEDFHLDDIGTLSDDKKTFSTHYRKGDAPLKLVFREGAKLTFSGVMARIFKQVYVNLNNLLVPFKHIVVTMTGTRLLVHFEGNITHDAKHLTVGAPFGYFLHHRRSLNDAKSTSFDTISYMTSDALSINTDKGMRTSSMLSVQRVSENIHVALYAGDKITSFIHIPCLQIINYNPVYVFFNIVKVDKKGEILYPKIELVGVVARPKITLAN